VIQAALVALLSAIILFEYQLFWEFPTLDTREPTYFADLARNDDVRAVFDVPWDNGLTTMQAMRLQMIHRKPMIAGQLYRRTPQDPAVMYVLEAALTGQGANGLPATIRAEDAPYILSQAGVDRVIVYKLIMLDAGPALDHMRAILGPPEFEDERYAVFAVPRTERAPDFALASVLGSGWQTMNENWVMLGKSGEWHFYVAEERYGDSLWGLWPYYIPRKVGVWLDDRLSAAWWSERGTQTLPLWVTPGFHTLRFEPLDGCSDYPFTLTCLWGEDCAPLNPPACVSIGFGASFGFWKPVETAPTLLAVELAQGVTLRAYSLGLLDGPRAAHVRLFWAAEHPLPDSYALFVHIADPVTAEPLAQYADYPLIQTDEWGDDSRWQSKVTIHLPDDLPPGLYAVNVGWFKPDTGERIAVQGDRPWASAGIVHLQMIDIE
jgi:hypothetical protein